MRSHQVVVIKIKISKRSKLNATLQQMRKNATARAQKAIQSD